ncbi:unnamed protein product [Caenorhabditis auriculariae]|uniref:CBS domain-containing protein n=1 Tax=Caenorhabditis auriculariae TaxID=2777116 RepID=A0A8S1GWZ7_9PELO|nr:unnamed protein product [Caenorhabditis auriculariae]
MDEKHAVASSPNLAGAHSPTNLQEGVLKMFEDHEALPALLWLNQCYEAMPSSSKMVVFDMGLLMHKAFNGLLVQGTRHVLLSDPDKNGALDGILKYRNILKREGKLQELVTVSANASLLEASTLLAQHRIHRLPVIDPDDGSALYILTHKRILKFLWIYGQQLAPLDYMKQTPKQLKVGTWSGIRVVFPDTPLVDCLEILLNKEVSGVPVVTRDKYKVVDIYSRFDAVGIALESRLDVTVAEALSFKNSFKKSTEERVVSVRDTDTFWKCVHVLVENSVHRLCALNEEGGIEGIISLSDVINFMVVKPGAALGSKKAPKRLWAKQHTGDLSDKELRDILLSNAANFELERERSTASQPDVVQYGKNAKK